MKKNPTKKVPTTTPKPTGRPSTYTKELADRICQQLSEGKSLRTVCLEDDMPNASTIFAWMREKEGFSKQYARAKQESADAMAEEILDIADDTVNVIKSGAEKKSSAYAQAQRLRVDTRKWLMSKHKPKKYADHVDLSTNGKDMPAPIIVAYGPTDRLQTVMQKRDRKKKVND